MPIHFLSISATSAVSFQLSVPFLQSASPPHGYLPHPPPSTALSGTLSPPGPVRVISTLRSLDLFLPALLSFPHTAPLLPLSTYPQFTTCSSVKPLQIRSSHATSVAVNHRFPRISPSIHHLMMIGSPTLSLTPLFFLPIPRILSGPEWPLPPLPQINNTALRTQVFTHRSFAARPTHVFEDTPSDPSPDNEM